MYVAQKTIGKYGGLTCSAIAHWLYRCNKRTKKKDGGGDNDDAATDSLRVTCRLCFSTYHPKYYFKPQRCIRGSFSRLTLCMDINKLSVICARHPGL